MAFEVEEEWVEDEEVEDLEVVDSEERQGVGVGLVEEEALEDHHPREVDSAVDHLEEVLAVVDSMDHQQELSMVDRPEVAMEVDQSQEEEGK